MRAATPGGGARANTRRLRVLMSRTLEIDPRLTWTTIVAGAALPRRPAPGPHLTHLANLFAEADGYHDRRYAMGIYRRAAAPVCLTVSTLVANALWPGSPFGEDVSNRNILYEAMRLLPPRGTCCATGRPSTRPSTAASGTATTS